MENLAEMEELGGEGPIRVVEEVRGVVPRSSCHMDPLFTRVESSLEASRVLRSLRMIVRCRGGRNSVSGGGGGVGGVGVGGGSGGVGVGGVSGSGGEKEGGGTLDPMAERRFEC